MTNDGSTRITNTGQPSEVRSRCPRRLRANRADCHPPLHALPLLVACLAGCADPDQPGVRRPLTSYNGNGPSSLTDRFWQVIIAGQSANGNPIMPSAWPFFLLSLSCPEGGWRGSCFQRVRIHWWVAGDGSVRLPFLKPPASMSRNKRSEQDTGGLLVRDLQFQNSVLVHAP